MSASDKKKLRKEQTAAYLTEKQRQEQAEAKKLKLYTIGFVSVMVLIACIAIGVLGYRAITQSGITEKSTIAAVVDGQELNTVVMNYYYNDAINQFYNEMYNEYEDYTDYYLQIMNLDVTKPMDEQYYDEETGELWSDYFLKTALDNAKSDYALAKEAEANNFTLPEEDQANIDSMLSTLDTYAQIYGFSNADKYLQAMYGYGSTVKNYTEYTERNALATAYLQHYHDTLSYTEDDYRAHDKDKESNYNAYTYDYVYLSYTNFRGEGTEDESGTVTYTEEQNDAAREAMKTAAEQLATCTTVDELKEMLKTIEVGEDSELELTSLEGNLHTNINGDLVNWLSSPDRKEGEIAAIPSVSTTTDDDGNETSATNGYYVACFHSMTDNNEPLANVRHLLVQFEGGTTDEETQETVYSDEEKAAAKEKAEEFLKTWKEGDVTEESFIALVEEHSDDTASVPDGGLYEDLYPGASYEPGFLNWAVDPARQKGDTGVVETSYGYHVMFYVGDDEMTYRDYMIDSELRDADHEAWYEALLETVSTELKDTSRMRLDITLSTG